MSSGDGQQPLTNEVCAQVQWVWVYLLDLRVFSGGMAMLRS